MTWQLGRAALTDGFTVVVAVLALVLILRLKTNCAWLVLGGGAAGLIYKLLFPT